MTPSSDGRTGITTYNFNRPKPLFQYETADQFRLAASLAHGLIKNPPFIDGNKRIGFLAATLFLRANGHPFHACEEKVVERPLALAAGPITEQDYATWLKQCCTK